MYIRRNYRNDNHSDYEDDNISSYEDYDEQDDEYVPDEENVEVDINDIPKSEPEPVMMKRNSNRDQIDRSNQNRSAGARGKTKKGRKKINFIRIFVNLIAIVTIFLSCGMIYWQAIKDNTDYTEKIVEDKNLPAVQTSQHDDIQYVLVCGLDESKKLTDVIMVVCWDIKKNTANILQIPRDTFIGWDVPTGKVNSVYGNPRENESKANALCRKINTHFGLPIDHYVFITLDAFVDIVDTLGGIEVDVTQYMYYEGVDIHPGKQVLDGKHAEVFMRFRKGYTTGDAGRVSMQRRFYAGLAEKLKDMSLGQILGVYNAVKADLVTDLSYSEIKSFISKAQKLDMEKVDIFAVPGEAYDHYYYSNGVRHWNALYTAHKAELVALLNEKMNPYGAEIFEEDLQLVELANTGYEPVEEGGNIGSYKGETIKDDSDDE